MHLLSSNLVKKQITNHDITFTLYITWLKQVLDVWVFDFLLYFRSENDKLESGAQTKNSITAPSRSTERQWGTGVRAVTHKTPSAWRRTAYVHFWRYCEAADSSKRFYPGSLNEGYQKKNWIHYGKRMTNYTDFEKVEYYCNK